LAYGYSAMCAAVETICQNSTVHKFSSKEFYLNAEQTDIHTDIHIDIHTQTDGDAQIHRHTEKRMDAHTPIHRNPDT